VELQISPKRTQIHSAYRLKKFIDPKTSKFLNEEKQKQERAEIQKRNSTPATILKGKKNLTMKLRPKLNNELHDQRQTN
jgi:hypothetical protein